MNPQEVYEQAKAKLGLNDSKEEIKRVLKEKAKESIICYDLIKNTLGFEDDYMVNFVADEKRFDQLVAEAFEKLNYPEKLLPTMMGLRLTSFLQLFEDEKVLQTGPLAAVLTGAANRALEISKLSGDEIDDDTRLYCDVIYAGLQAVRLYFVATYDENFTNLRAMSSASIINAYNGIFYKYKTKKNRKYSYHLYYEHQKESIANAMNFGKDPKDINMLSLEEDIKHLAELTGDYDPLDLEEFVFDNGGSGCVIRNREEWDELPVGKAVNAMDLLTFDKNGAKGLKGRKLGGPRGILDGLKVLDLTHIIAGPAATRLLAEYGADVLLVRRKPFMEQEQKTLELDGWAGKRAIDLDFNRAEDYARFKELVKEADVVVTSYSNSAFEKFGLKMDDIREINPDVILSQLVCFSSTEWLDRPGWAPLAEDITGLSLRNGENKEVKNLNGVPLDYIPGLILGLGTMEAIARSLKDGGGYKVFTSLTRGAVWLHECTDYVESHGDEYKNLDQVIDKAPEFEAWEKISSVVKDNAVGDIAFPAPAVVSEAIKDPFENMQFVDGVDSFRK